MNRMLRPLVAASLALASATALTDCHSGTPAAPDGTKIFISFEYVAGTLNAAAGNFQARVKVVLMDSTTNVPRVGVGVFFQVESGPGTFEDTQAVVTDTHGYAEDILDAHGAVAANGTTAANPVKVSAFSGTIQSASLSIDASGGTTTQNQPPVCALTTTPASGTSVAHNANFTVDVGASTDPTCSGNKPDHYKVSWGDSTADTTQQFSTPTTIHQYTTAGSYTLTVTVFNCTGASCQKTQSVTVT